MPTSALTSASQAAFRRRRFGDELLERVRAFAEHVEHAIANRGLDHQRFGKVPDHLHDSLGRNFLCV